VRVGPAGIGTLLPAPGYKGGECWLGVAGVSWWGAPLPADPVERIRCLRVLREAYRRQVKPKLRETYRKVGGRTYGPYYVAYFKRTPGRRHPRLIYLGKSNPSVEFVEWLAEQSRRTVLDLARLAVRHLRAALERIVREAPRVENVRGLVARTLALAFDLEPAGLPQLRDLLDRAPKFTRVILGPWEAWFAERVLRRLLYRRSRDGKHWVPDARLELERWLRDDSNRDVG